MKKIANGHTNKIKANLELAGFSPGLPARSDRCVRGQDCQGSVGEGAPLGGNVPTAGSAEFCCEVAAPVPLRWEGPVHIDVVWQTRRERKSLSETNI